MDIVTFFQWRPEIPYIMAALYVTGLLLKAYPKLRNNWIPLILTGISIVITILTQLQRGAIPPWSLTMLADTALQGLITCALTVGLYTQYKDTYRAFKQDDQAYVPGTGNSNDQEGCD